jgi:hypothetical protein
LHAALVLSLLAHALLLSITLGGQTFGLPGLNFPWKERRLGADDLRIFLAPSQPAAPASAPARIDISPTEMANAARAEVDRPAVASSVTSMAMPPPAVGHCDVAPPTPATTPAPAPVPVISAAPPPDVILPAAPAATSMKAPASSVARNIPAQASEVPLPIINAGDAAQKQVEQDTRERALELARLEHEKQSAEKLRQAELTADAQREALRQTQLRQDAARAEQTARSEAARMEAERQELARQEGLRREALQKERARQDEKAQQEAARQTQERAEAARLDAERREAARQEQTRQAQLEAARQAQLDAARQDAIKQEAARRDALRQEAARLEAARMETTRQEQARQAQVEVARQAQLEAARQEAARQEAAKRDAIQQEAARQDAIKQEAARQERAKQELAQRDRAEQEAKREERLRAIGKQLNEEAARRDAALNPASRTLLPTVSSLRRGWLFGRADPNADLVLYAEAMSKKIEMNMTFDMVRDSVKQPHARPVVTVALRADGSVEKVTFVVSSGIAAIDEAIRKVVASQAPYGAFPPALARQYDVIEIRRTWIFDSAIRLQ